MINFLLLNNFHPAIIVRGEFEGKRERRIIVQRFGHSLRSAQEVNFGSLFENNRQSPGKKIEGGLNITNSARALLIVAESKVGRQKLREKRTNKQRGTTRGTRHRYRGCMTKRESMKKP